VVLTARANKLSINFGYGPDIDQQKQIGPVQSLDVISDEIAGKFNGSYVGMYATSNGEKSKAQATFQWFDYSGE